jgi:hypothetical protein
MDCRREIPIARRRAPTVTSNFVITAITAITAAAPGPAAHTTFAHNAEPTSTP